MTRETQRNYRVSAEDVIEEIYKKYAIPSPKREQNALPKTTTELLAKTIPQAFIYSDFGIGSRTN